MQQRLLSRQEFLQYIIVYLGVTTSRTVRQEVDNRKGASEELWDLLRELWTLHLSDEIYTGEYDQEGAKNPIGYWPADEAMWIPTDEQQQRRLFKEYCEDRQNHAQLKEGGRRKRTKWEKFKTLHRSGRPLYNATLSFPEPEQGTYQRWKELGFDLEHDDYSDTKEVLSSFEKFPTGKITFRGQVIVGFLPRSGVYWLGIKDEEDIASLEQAKPSDQEEEPATQTHKTARGYGPRGKPLTPGQIPSKRYELFAAFGKGGAEPKKPKGRRLRPAGHSTRDVLTDEQLDQVVKLSRRPCADRTFEAFRSSLCEPLDPRELLQQEGKDWQPSARAVPDLFTYLPHRLSRRPEAVADRQDPDRWEETALKEVVNELLENREEPWCILVEATAGFGKTAFLHHLSLAVAERDDVLALRPVRFADLANPAKPVAEEELARLFKTQLRTQTGQRGVSREDLAYELLCSGRVVLFLDGLDQVPNGFGNIRGFLGDCPFPLKIVAACRKELGKGAGCDCFDTVLRLAAPDPKNVSSEELPPEVKDELKTALEDDPYHPFWIHAARLLYFWKKLPSAGSCMQLVRAYLNQVMRLAAEHADKDQRLNAGELSSLQDDLRKLMGVVALDSLQHCSKKRTPTLGQLPDDIRRHALARVKESASDFPVGKVFDYATGHAALVYLSEGSFDNHGKVWVFQHQLLQEYLAAQELVEQLDRRVRDSNSRRGHKAAFGQLVRSTRNIVQPQDPFNETRHSEDIDRVLVLRLWRFVVELLAEGEHELTPSVRSALVSSTTKVLSPTRNHGRNLGDACRTALLRIRDLLLECDHDLVAYVRRHYSKPFERLTDPCAQQFNETTVPPDPFMLLTWKQERNEIARLQPRQEECERLEEIMRNQEPKRGWTVEPTGHLVIAATSDGERWSFVPPGEFVAGGARSWKELPVRLQATRAYWMAELPVSNGQYREFLEVAYANRLADDCWEPFREEARDALSDPYGPMFWKDDSPPTESVAGISWFEAAAYCRWLSCKYSNDGSYDLYRLPSEAEWEKGARGLFGRIWPWGCLFKEDLLWSRTHGLTPKESGTAWINLVSSPFGVREMTAGYLEWTCSSWEELNFGEEISFAGAWDQIAARGGVTNHGYVRWCALRNECHAIGLTNVLGFHCVREVPDLED